MSNVISFRLLRRNQKFIIILFLFVILFYIFFKWNVSIKNISNKDVYAPDQNFLIQSKDIRKSLDYIFSDIPHYMRQRILDVQVSNPQCRSPLTLPLVYSDLNERTLIQDKTLTQTSLNTSYLIPRILHQTWKTTTVPASLSRYVSRWQQILAIDQNSFTTAHQPSISWLHILWTDSAAREFVSRHYPELLDAYDRARFGVVRADIFRLLVLHKFGGLYADLVFFAII